LDWEKEAGEKIREAATILLTLANLEPDQILVIGCSTSEILGKKIGSASNREIARIILRNLLELTRPLGVHLAIQCCEHLNRALVVEKELVKSAGLETVEVYPVAKAGGALASMAMDLFRQPVVVENIKAHAGIDIGNTFIGMHLRPVVVPVRAEIKKIGEANLTMAKTRPKLIGGFKAAYCKS